MRSGATSPSLFGQALGAAPAAVLGALTALRGRRIFHPIGVAFTGVCRVPTNDPQILPAGEHEAIVRFSRGAGLPTSIPDVLGIAIKLPGLGVNGGDQDFLLVSSGEQPGLRRLLLPAGRFEGPRFSSVLGYRNGDGPMVLLGAGVMGVGDRRLDDPRSAPETRPFSVRLESASRTGSWRPAASIELRGRIPQAQADALRFDPWNTSEHLHPHGLLNAVRAPAYRVSQLLRSVLGWRQADPARAPSPKIESVPITA